LKPLMFTASDTGDFGQGLSQAFSCDMGVLSLHQYPDGEQCPRFATPVEGRDVIFAWALDRPDYRLLTLYLVASVARELGARSIGFVIPYLPYVRQDVQRHAGQGETSRHIARLLSGCCDWLVTIDPPLKRFQNLSDIYSVPVRVVPSAPAIADWINAHVAQPVIFGAGLESEPWIAQIAAAADCPHVALPNTRGEDRQVSVSIPDAPFWVGMTPVLVDDVVSTARTMIAATVQIEIAGMAPPVCIVVHPLFAGDGYAALQTSRVDRIVSCNTIAHATNRIDLSKSVTRAIQEVMAEKGAHLGIAQV